jgi:protein O-GlcNAc transferase
MARTTAGDDAAFTEAIGSLQAGRLDNAERQLKAVLARQPRNVMALDVLGALLASQQRFSEAELHLRSALQLNPSSDVTLYNHGIALSGLGRPSEALRQFDKAIALKPNVGRTWLAKGHVLHALGRSDEALDAFSKALALQPVLVEAWFGRGNVFYERTRYHEALAAYEQALASEPDNAEAWLGCGNALTGLGRYDQAFAAYDKALERSPRLAGAWVGRGNVLTAQKRFDEAMSAHDKAIALMPDLAVAWLGRGNVLYEMTRYGDALTGYDKALALVPDLAGAWLGRGNACAELKRYGEAVSAYDKALRLNPDLKYTEGARLHSKQHICDWTNLDAEWTHLLAAIRHGAAASAPFAILAGPSSTADQIKCAQIYTADKCSVATEQLWQNERYSHSRIRIAYVSPDFRDHAVPRLLASLFEQHDRTQFETIAIALGPDDQSEMRTRLKLAFDRFIDVHGQSDWDAARLMRELEVDIVVDLGGFTFGSRPAILAFRPAPIQVTYLSYPGIMGAGYIDYVLADRFVIPEDHRSLQSERVVYLPNAYLGYDSTQNISEQVPTRAEQGLPETGFVFCAYNNTFKIMPPVFDIWMRLLRTISGSVLWLMGTNATATDNLRREARARGVEPDRLCFAPYVKNVADHLARYRLADLFLDTLPFNAQTTACDALWAGLPVLTRLGSTFVGRAAASLLSAIDLPELIAHSAVEYEALALKFATDASHLAEIRRKLAEHRLTTPLFNTKLFTRHVEAAYSAMVERHRAGLRPDHIVVPH